MLGTGGSQFPVSVVMGESRKLDEDEVSSMEATMFVSATVIKICFRESFGGTANSDAIILKYTIDYPRIELHPFDTQRFKLFYSDDKIDAKYHFDRCIELKALSRQSRDIIALAIKSFSAHTYYINSKIISDVRWSMLMQIRSTRVRNGTVKSTRPMLVSSCLSWSSSKENFILRLATPRSLRERSRS